MGTCRQALALNNDRLRQPIDGSQSLRADAASS
jgi:hypothetical protein